VLLFINITTYVVHAKVASSSDHKYADVGPGENTIVSHCMGRVLWSVTKESMLEYGDEL